MLYYRYHNDLEVLFSVGSSADVCIFGIIPCVIIVFSTMVSGNQAIFFCYIFKFKLILYRQIFCSIFTLHIFHLQDHDMSLLIADIQLSLMVMISTFIIFWVANNFCCEVIWEYIPQIHYSIKNKYITF